MTAAGACIFMFFALILVGCGLIAQAAVDNGESAQHRKETSSWPQL
jgi:hypothetical protein